MSNRNLVTIAFLIIFGVFCISVDSRQRRSIQNENRITFHLDAVIPNCTTESIVDWLEYKSKKNCRTDIQKRKSNVKVRRR